jgi:hypothetical protein
MWISKASGDLCRKYTEKHGIHESSEGADVLLHAGYLTSELWTSVDIFRLPIQLHFFVPAPSAACLFPN